ncbi:MAG: hypothetical protein KatS3mg010_1321 [Acidimicrobiia bacterium]|nr:MAG: hypothetical protein KatS3mg010_1321 [Acidimicrobiia bacterium]
MDPKKLSPGAIVIIAAGALMLIGSFLDFWTIEFFGVSESRNAWSGDTAPGFPFTIIPVLCGVVMAVHVALTAFGNVNLPDRLLGFTWSQLHLVLGVQAAIMMLAMLIQDKDPADPGIGFWLMLLAAIGLVVGAVLREREPAAT